jgi:hypothetical protein
MMEAAGRQPDPRHCGVAHLRLPEARFRAVNAVAVGLIVMLAPCCAWPQEVEVLLPEKECQVKYALLYSFGLLTTWPAQSFDPPETGPFVIGVLGSKPYPEYLARIAESKKVQNRPIVIRRFKAPEEIGRCHLLYITNAVTLEVEQAAVRKLADQPVLVVSERQPEAGASAAVIQFVIEQGAVKFVLDAEAAKARQLQIDARLLKLAKRSSSDIPR